MPGTKFIPLLESLLAEAQSKPSPPPVVERQPTWEATDTEKIPRDPVTATAPPKNAPAVGGLNREEQKESHDKLPLLLKECFEGMDKGLKFGFPIYKVDMTKMEPEIWSEVSYAQCQRLSSILIEIGIINPYVAQVIRLANQTDDARFVLKIFGLKGLATGTYVQSSIKQQRQIRAAKQRTQKGS